MVNLCYATFLQLVQEHYIIDIEAELLARDLLSEILPDEEYRKFDGDTGKKYLSSFWTRKRNIPKPVRESVVKPKYKAACLKHFTDVIVPDINPVLADDFYSRLALMISNDDSITARKKASLHALDISGNRGKYLTEVFLYAITKENKDSIVKLDDDTVPLLSQVDQMCPICYQPLIKPVKNSKPIYTFTVTRIYPEYLDPAIKDQFDSIKPKPSDPDDPQNKICLCDACSLEYIHDPTPAMYDRLIKLKKKTVFSGVSSTIVKFELEEKIVTILDNLANTNPEGELIQSFRMKPLKPCNKIPKENYLLIKSIKDDNEVFYWFIKDHISNIDSNKSSFRIIATEIKGCFLKLDEEGYSQDDIFQGLIDWIINKQLLPNSYKEAAHVIISYFVQNCEVFDEISE